MKASVIATIFFCLSSFIVNAQNVFVSLEGKFSTSPLGPFTSFNNESLTKYYLSPAVGIQIKENLYAGFISRITRMNYLKFYPLKLDYDDYSVNIIKYGIFVERLIVLSDKFLLRIRPSVLYQREGYSEFKSGSLEFQIAPGVIYKAGNKIYIYTNFRGIGVEREFYFDFGFDQLNLGLQFNLSVEGK